MTVVSSIIYQCDACHRYVLKYSDISPRRLEKNISAVFNAVLKDKVADLKFSYWQQIPLNRQALCS